MFKQKSSNMHLFWLLKVQLCTHSIALTIHTVTGEHECVMNNAAEL